MKRVAFITDAYEPQVNGVVTTIKSLKDEIKKLNYQPLIISPTLFPSLPNPFYPEIRLCSSPKQVRQYLELLDDKVDYYHIFTEGLIGLTAKKWLQEKGYRFTSSFHTKWPEFLNKKFKLPKSPIYKYLKNFHNSAECTLVTTESMKDDLTGRGFTRLLTWTRGVDRSIFNPSYANKEKLGLKYPTYTYVGRVSSEKNIEAFLNLDLDGDKLVIGDGPLLESLKRRYPEVKFVGKKQGVELAEYISSSDVHVFTSRFDTFGVVILEAMACGVPTAAYPVTGPIDIIKNNRSGYMDNNLKTAIEHAQYIDCELVLNEVDKFSWDNAAGIFADNLVVKK